MLVFPHAEFDEITDTFRSSNRRCIYALADIDVYTLFA